jgi:radical SAM protein with 4Fe4S-binding SPASM domain
VVSIGEAKKETYEKLRKGGSFEKVISNIKKLDTLKKERNSMFPRICANLTLVNSNIGELIDFIDLAQNLGVQRIIGRHLILNEGLDMTNEIVRDKTQVNEIIDIAEAKAVSYGMTFSIPQYASSPPKSCKAPWQQLYISSNGDVSVCPRIHRYEKIGNLLEDSFASIIKSDKMKKLKDQFTQLEFRNPVCKICMENRETEQAINQGF